MTWIELKPEIERALKTRWPRFAEEHPNLAAALDQGAIIEQATASLRDDPEFVAAIANASTARRAGEAVAEVVGRFVGAWLGRLAG
jgi:hypothetical protein